MRSIFCFCQGNFKETYELAEEFGKEHFKKDEIDKLLTVKTFVDAYCDGVNWLLKIPLFSKRSTLKFVLNNVGIDSGYLKLNIVDRLRLGFLNSLVFLVANCPMFECALNYGVMKLIGSDKTASGSHSGGSGCPFSSGGNDNTASGTQSGCPFSRLM